MTDILKPGDDVHLLGLARRAIKHYLETGETLDEPPLRPDLSAARGVFVSLKTAGRLRGCIGYSLPVKPLNEAVVEMAVAAASRDSRFEPLTPDELINTTIEISVLSPPRSVRSARDVEPGRHGIIISRGGAKGLLLPQVAEEHGWDRETFLRHACLKAGLPPDAWTRDARIEVFTARIFSETSAESGSS